MHYYQFNIAAWALHTSHLTLEEECIYRRLIDYYYDTESPIPEETKPVIRRLRLISHEPIVKLILQEFFHLEADGWHNSRADIEIADFKLKANKARENGKKGGRPKQNKGIETKPVILANPEETTSKANYKLRTINYELETNSLVTPQAAQPSAKKQKSDLDYSVWPEQPDQQILNDWLQLRNSKKAKVSQTVLNAFGEEFRKAATFGYSVNDCLTAAISGGWQGFKFSWMQNQLTRGQQIGNTSQPKPSLIDRFIQNNYAGTGFENDHRPMGSDDCVIRGEVVEPIRGGAGCIGPMEADLIGDFKAASGFGD